MAGLFIDQGWRDRCSVGNATATLAYSWFGESHEGRAAMAAAIGDYLSASNIAGGPWKCLFEGDLLGTLRQTGSNSDNSRTLAMSLAEAEALMGVGAITAALERLEDMHRAIYPAATVALARHRHRLGDHLGAEDAAMTLSGNVHAAITGAKAAMIERRAGSAIRLLEPFLCGAASLPDPMIAGALSIIAASALARLGQRKELENLSAGLLGAFDLDPEMMPAAARVAWTAGHAAEAWERFEPELGQWSVAARIELALLSGNVALAAQMKEQAGSLAEMSRHTIRLVNGDECDEKEGQKVLSEGKHIHLWRTHAQRWQPWIEAAKASGAKIEVFDLSIRNLPNPTNLPEIALDDSALLNLVNPSPVSVRKKGTGCSGIWVHKPLCAGVGIGHDWSSTEESALTKNLSDANQQAKSPETAAVWIVNAEIALATASLGRPSVVLAPPGDPFWAGPLPERAWPALRVLRADPRHGWTGFGKKVAEVALTLLAER
ncbi:MAG: hypothetical protein OXC62_12385 [Aestuariivita sp.]|nr:hypothetical protein [Aestuariivita sp.]